MTQFVIRRLGWTVLVLFVMSVITFSMIRLMPGDPAIILLGQRADVKLAAAIRKSLGLDQPLVTQYVHWIGGLFRGDLGISVAVFGTSGPSGSPVSTIVTSALSVTIPLALLGMIFAGAIGVATGILGAFWQGSRKD